MAPWCSTSSGLGWVAMVAGWVLVVGLAVWAVCRLFPGQARPEARPPRGEPGAGAELDAEQYRELRDTLDDRSGAKGTP